VSYLALLLTSSKWKTRFVMKHSLEALAACMLSVALSPPTLAQVSVLTHHNDNARTGQNLSETTLTPAVVNTRQFGELFTNPLDGMVVAQPLYVPKLQINGASHNVVFVATLHDGVYAFDADNNTGNNDTSLWYASLIDPPKVTTVPVADQGCPKTGFTEVGIVGTPVIDPSTNTMYLVAKTLESGKYVHRLHALDITTGREKLGGPVVIKGSYDSDGNKVTFQDRHRMQRPALLLSEGMIYIAFGTAGCAWAPPSAAWMMAYDASNLKQLAALDVGPTQQAIPGMWMAGDGPSVDSSGDVYVATGDGHFDYNIGGLDYGDTLLKLGLGDGSFSLVDYFTPYNQADLYARDLDLGSSGLVILPDQRGQYPHLGIIAGKEGMIYLVDRDNLGQYNSMVDQVVQEEPFDPAKKVEIDGGATYWNHLVYFGGVGQRVKAFSLIDGVLSSGPVATSAAAHCSNSVLSLSANGARNGILWCVESHLGRHDLNAFNATNLKLLYSSNQNPTRDPLGLTTHFDMPTIANGRVYVGTSKNLVVFGLLPKTMVYGGNNQTGEVGSELAQPLQVNAVDSYEGKPIPGVTIHFSDGGAGGSFSNPNPVTNADGIASTTYTLPKEAGTYASISATNARFFSPSNFTETAVAHKN
jgi:hypothetical protein